MRSEGFHGEAKSWHSLARAIRRGLAKHTHSSVSDCLRHQLEARSIETNEYQQLAHECVRWAARAKTEGERMAFLEMSRAWTLAAMRAAHTLRSDDTLTPLVNPGAGRAWRFHRAVKVNRRPPTFESGPF
jgi:hypothetical protein